MSGSDYQILAGFLKSWKESLEGGYTEYVILALDSAYQGCLEKIKTEKEAKNHEQNKGITVAV